MPGIFSKKNSLKLAKKAKHDANFNLKIEVEAEMAVARQMMLHPSDKLLASIKSFSDIIVGLIDDAEIKLAELFTFPECMDYLDKFFGSESGYYGLMTGTNIPDWMNEVLRSDVSAQNIIDHLTIHNKIACILWEVSTEFCKASPELFNKVKESVVLMLRKSGSPLQNDDELFQCFIHRCLQLFPSDEDMTDIRKLKISQQKPLQNVITAGIRPSKGHGLSVEKTKEHKRGADVWRVLWNSDCDFVKDAFKHGLPLISGASGTTARWLSLIELCQFHNNAQEEFKEYAAAIAAYMPHCGHHSWHETASVLVKLGIEYDKSDRFASIIPEAVLAPEQLQDIVAQFFVAGSQSPQAHSIDNAMFHCR